MRRGARKTSIAVWDMDGTLADNSRRIARLNRDNPDWDEFHADQHLDPILADQRALVQICEDAGLATVILTARPERYREPTEWWLAKHGMFPDAVLMRGEDDSTDTVEYKSRVLTALQEVFIVRLVVDDHRGVIMAAREMGLPTVYIHSNYYDDSTWGTAVAVDSLALHHRRLGASGA